MPDGVDAVVIPRAGRPRWVPTGVGVTDGDVLYERAVYGVTAATRERLFREYFGESPVDTDDGAEAGLRRRRRVHAAITVVALAVVVTAIVGLPGTPDTGGTQAVDGDVTTPTPFIGSSADLSTARKSIATLTPASTDAYPPGVNESGIVDPSTLLDARAEVL
jgi:hypothetical protein